MQHPTLPKLGHSTLIPNRLKEKKLPKLCLKHVEVNKGVRKMTKKRRIICFTTRFRAKRLSVTFFYIHLRPQLSNRYAF